MADSGGGKSIAERCSDVRRSLLHALEKSKTAESPVEVRKVEDVLDRFKLWTGNLGALHQAQKQMSLESRLAESPEVKDQICEHLDDMQEASEDLLSLLSDSRPEPEVNTEHAEDTAITNAPIYDLLEDTPSEYMSKSEEADSILCMVSECLKALFRVGILVRKATPRDRFERALQRSEHAFTAQFDISYIKEKYPKLASKTSAGLTSRLGNANSKRRQFINYVRDHRTKLEAEDPRPMTDGTTTRQSSKATTFVVPRNISTSEFLQSSLEVEDDLTSLVSASTTFDDEASLRLPSLADLGPDGEYFECPICFTLQSFRTEKSWKLHAYRDLKAYVCTSVAQDCEHKMFSDRDTWFDHELDHHYSLYVCKFCGCHYADAKPLQHHLINEHGLYSNDEIKSVSEHGKLVPSQLKAQDCPFCDKWASILSQRRHGTGERAPSTEGADVLVSLTHFKRHVATHQEQLAIFAMPRMMNSDDERSHVADDSNSEVFSSNGGVPQNHDVDEFELVLQTLEEDFKATMTAMCDELLASPTSDPQAWKDQYMTIVKMVSKEYERRRRDIEASIVVPDVLESNHFMAQALRVLIVTCPSFAPLMAKYPTLSAPGTELENGQHLTANRFRVKIYKFVDDGWEDQGTGFCRAFVIYSHERRLAHIVVHSEMTPERLMIQEQVQENSNFQRSGEDLIVWSDSQTDITMALSFQEMANRDEVWKIVDSVQRHIEKQSVQPVIYDDIGHLDVAASRPGQETEANPSEAADLFRELAFGEEQKRRPTSPKVSKRFIDKIISCPHCPAEFLHAKDLNRHLLSRHDIGTKEPPYMCVRCRRTFSRGDNLKRHHQRCRMRRESPTSASHLDGQEGLTQAETKNVDSEPDCITAMTAGRADRPAVLNTSRDLSDMNEQSLNETKSNIIRE